MPLTSTKSSTNKEYVSPFEDQGYLARVVQIVDLGKQAQLDWQTKEPKESKYEVAITFEFPEVRVTVNEEDRPAWLTKRYQFPQSWPDKTGLKNNTNLYKLFSNFVPSYLKQSDMYPAYYFMNDGIWDALLGAPVYIEVAHTNKGRPKIVSVGKTPSFVKEIPDLENNAILFDTGTATVEEWTSLPLWMRKIVLEAEDEYTQEAARNLESQVDNTEEPKEKPKQVSKKKTVEEDDDIPF